MEIRTLERLDRVPIGEIVEVGTTNWTRQADGLESASGEVLPLMAFKGYAQNGELKVPTEVQLGAWRTYDDHYYLVVAVDPFSDDVIALCWRHGMFSSVVEVGQQMASRWSVSRQGPGDVPPAQWALGIMALRNKLLPAVPWLGQQHQDVGSGLLAALHTMAAQTPGLDEVLIAHHVGRSRTGEVTVSAKGTAKVDSSLFGGIEVDDTEVGWKFGYTFASVAPITDPCLCATFDEAKFKVRLPASVLFEEHTVSCSESDCVNK